MNLINVSIAFQASTDILTDISHSGWYAEKKPDCKTPMVCLLCYGGPGLILEKHRRLTRQMKRELVKSLRTVALLAIFSPDSNTVGNIQSCLKSMSIMEPDLILLPILERAIPSLEALVEVCGAYNPGS